MTVIFRAREESVKSVSPPCHAGRVLFHTTHRTEIVGKHLLALRSYFARETRESTTVKTSQPDQDPI
jgi:hypothetical protein